MPYCIPLNLLAFREASYVDTHLPLLSHTSATILAFQSGSCDGKQTSTLKLMASHASNIMSNCGLMCHKSLQHRMKVVHIFDCACVFVIMCV